MDPFPIYEPHAIFIQLEMMADSSLPAADIEIWANFSETV